MTLTNSNLVAWHGLTSSEHATKRDSFAEKGFRPLSISLYGAPASPRYVAVMVKRPTVIATRSFMDLSQQGYQDAFDKMAAEGFGPFLITATGPKTGALFAGSFRKVAKIPLTRPNLSKQEFIDLNRAQKDAGNMLVWVDSFGSTTDPRYCAIWGPNPDKIAWNIDAVDEGDPLRQQRFEAMRSMGARPTLVAMTPAGRVCRMYSDTDIGKWDSRTGLTADEYQARFNTNASEGLWPICVSASGAGDNARFSAIFATREDTAARTVTMTGTGAHAAIDAKMAAVIKDRNLRGCALAIGRGTRLLYARGFTFAEPGYADIQPETLFRQASVSKSFCALAIWKLIDQGDLSLAHTLQSVLHLKQPDGSNPVDGRFADITIRHLLESRSGLRQGNIYAAVDASDAMGGSLPSNGTEIARLCASQMLTGAPGDSNNSVYGNMDYLMLSLVVAKKMNAASFEAALKTLVLDPLKMSHTRASRTRAEDQPAGEARHHMTVHNPTASWPLHQFECNASVKLPDQPLAPSHYGAWDYEFLDGCGGLSSSVVDVARLCAALSCRTNNPVINPERIDDMMAAAHACRTQKGPDGKGSHGYHGFDWVDDTDPENDRWEYSKGGWLPGQGTTMGGITGGYFYVYAQNGNTPAGAMEGWLDEIEDIVEAHNWGDTNLFPTYGMPALPTLAMKAMKSVRIAGRIAQRSLQVEQSMVQQAGKLVLRPRGK